MTQRKLTIQLDSPRNAINKSAERFIQAWDNGVYRGEYLTFTSATDLFELLNARRWDMISTLQNLGKVSIRELARQLNRDVHRVHDDITVLISQGIVTQDKNGVYVPFNEIHTDFTLKAKAA